MMVARANNNAQAVAAAIMWGKKCSTRAAGV
jgi:hypothetical protein